MRLVCCMLLAVGMMYGSLWCMEQAGGPPGKIKNGDRLERVIRKGRLESVKFLLKEGVDPSAPGSYFKSHPIVVAAGIASLPECPKCKEPSLLSRAEAKKIIERLIKRTGAIPDLDVESKTFFSQLNANNNGAYTGYEEQITANIKKLVEEVLEKALRAGSEVNKQDREGKTLLHRAAQENNKEFVEDLIKAGADVNIKDKNGETPLHQAASSGSTALIEPLFKAGAKLDIQDRNGDTPLHKAISNNQANAAETLIELGASVNTKNKAGKMPLEMAQELPDKAVIEKIDEKDKECSVCLEEFSEDVPETLTVCKHRFHTHCLTENKIKACPMCRHEL